MEEHTTRREVRDVDTHHLPLGAPEVEEHHADAVVRGHAQVLEGLVQQNVPPHPGLFRVQREALVYVHSQHALLPVPAARCEEGENR